MALPQTVGNLLDDRLSKLQARMEAMEQQQQDKEMQLMQLLAGKANVQEAASRQQLEELSQALNSKAEADEVATPQQVLAIYDALQNKAEASEVPTTAQLEVLKRILELKADSASAASKAELAAAKDELVAQMRATAASSRESLQEAAESASAKCAQLALQLQGLQYLESKVQAHDSNLELIDAKLQDKADASEVPTNGRLQAVMKMLVLKADAARVPSITEFQELVEQLQSAQKAKQQLDETMEQLQQRLQNKAEALELRRLGEELQRKADLGEVATALEVQLLNGALQSKAESKDVATLEQLQALSKAVENKADSWDVPSLPEFRALDQHLRRCAETQHLEQLKTVLQQKADAETVVRREDFEQLMTEVQGKATREEVPCKEEFDLLKAGVELKANTSEVPTLQSFQALLKDVPSRAAIMVLNQALHSKANVCAVPTKEELKVLTDVLSSKADLNMVPTWKDFHALRDRVQRKADREAVPSTAQFQTLNATVAKISEGRDMLKRRRESPEPGSYGPAPLTPEIQLPEPATPGVPGNVNAPGTPAKPTPFAPRKARTPGPVATPARSTRQPAMDTAKEPQLQRSADRVAKKKRTPSRDKADMHGQAGTPSRTAEARKRRTPSRDKGDKDGQAGEDDYRRPTGKAPRVKHGENKGKAMIWNSKQGAWEEPASRRLHAEGLQLEGSSELSAKSTSWDGVVLLGALALVLVMFLDVGKSMEFSVPHLVCYNLVCLRVPDVLGHWVVMTVAGLQMSPGTTTTAISFAYMGAMQAYLVALKWVCRHMSAPDMFPRFHFIAQMYYYLFWYMMLMVLAPGGVDDRNFWMMVVFLNGTSLVSNAGVLSLTRAFLRPGSGLPDPPLKVLFDSKLAVQDQLADVVSLLVVPAIATSFHICTSLRVPNYPIGPLLSLWQRFLVLLLARLLSGLLTEEIFRRRVDVLNKAEALELQLLPIDGSQNRTRYLSDICIGPKLALEAMRNIERLGCQECRSHSVFGA
ncbi:unnamed protein product [Effrenium voratum]|nr:unnamed protein product [Effrenium voratum]